MMKTAVTMRTLPEVTPYDHLFQSSENIAEIAVDMIKMF